MVFRPRVRGESAKRCIWNGFLKPAWGVDWWVWRISFFPRHVTLNLNAVIWVIICINVWGELSGVLSHRWEFHGSWGEVQRTLAKPCVGFWREMFEKYIFYKIFFYLKISKKNPLLWIYSNNSFLKYYGLMTVKQYKFYRIYLQFLFVFFYCFFLRILVCFELFDPIYQKSKRSDFFPGDALVYNFI